MNDIFSQRVRIADDVLLRELDGEAIILDLNSERYYGLDEVGTRMWELLVTSDSIADAYEALVTEYEVNPSQLHQDMHDLLTELIDSGLITLETT